MSNQYIRRVRESPLFQGQDEQIAYILTTTPWGSTPTNPSVVLFDNADTDVSGTNMTGAASISGDEITTPTVTGLTAGKQYRMEIQFTISGNIFEAYVEIHGQV